MPKPLSSEQRAIDEGVKADMKNKFKQDVDEETSSKEEDPAAQTTGEETDDVKNRKKELDKTKKETDTDTTDASKSKDDPNELYDAVVDQIIETEFDGDDSKRSEAVAIANIATKTFDADPIKAAKSYRNLNNQILAEKSVLSKNPFLKKLIDEAKSGKVIDENHVQSLLGAASADQPTKQPPSGTETKHDELGEDDFDLDKLTAEELISSGVLDQGRYDSASGVDRRDMVEKARIRYGYKVLPQKMAERTAKLSQKKQEDMKQQRRIDEAKQTNQQRLTDNYRDVVSKYDLDFDQNPEHQQLWDEVKAKAYRIPDLDDENGHLIADNAVEQAVQHVFNKHNVPLQASASQQITEDAPDQPSNSTPSNTDDRTTQALKRILGATGGFKGNAAKRPGANTNSEGPQDLNDRVTQRTTQLLQRSSNNAAMLSGQRKTDRTK